MDIDLNKIKPIIDKYSDEQGSLIPILNEVQKTIGYLPAEAQEYISDSLNIPLSKIYGVITFYAQFSTVPKGDYVIHACDGTACHVRDSRDIIDVIKDELSLDGENNTTDDGKFTLETVSCIGACGLAPVVTINEKVYGKLTPDKIRDVINDYQGREQSV
ncbi:MAG: NADH-quinone oxidoreductase subunit NuoE [Halanaerobiales bacterium]|nr:NADH-quinone oxidoreductase subunit NuoE [Halanaerobiales bacterium]